MNKTKFQAEYEVALARIRKIKDDRDRLLTAARELLTNIYDTGGAMDAHGRPRGDVQKLCDAVDAAQRMNP